MPLDVKQSTIDWLVCQCGNDPSRDGFYTCTKDGAFADPRINGPWGGSLYVCVGCYSIYDIDTFDEIGMASAAAQKSWINGTHL